jgi:hypothetical protein
MKGEKLYISGKGEKNLTVLEGVQTPHAIPHTNSMKIKTFE